MPIDFTPLPPKIDFSPVAASPMDAKPQPAVPKIPEPKPAAKINFAPAKAAPAKPSFAGAAVEGAYAPFKPIVDKTKASIVRNAGDIKDQLKGRVDTSNPIAAIGDIGSRIGRAGLDAANIAFSPLEGAVKASTSAVASMIPGDQKKLQKVAEDTGDLLTQAALVPTGVTKARGAAEILDNAAVAKAAAPAKIAFTPAKVASITPASTSDQLFKLSNDLKASRIEAGQTLQKIDAVPEKTWEKLYAYQDSPKTVQLSPEEQQIYDSTIKPVEAQRQKLIQDITGKGYSVGDIGGAPRQVKGAGTPMDSLTGTKASPVSGRSLSTRSTATSKRSMYAMEDAQGKRQVVYVNPDGEVYAVSKGGPKVPVGTVDKVEPGEDISNGHKLQNATTAEIESATDIDYHKNLIGNEYTSLMQLKRAKNNIDFIENLKKDPDFGLVAEPVSRGKMEGWRVINGVPQFKDFKFRPDIAEAVEDYLGDAKNPNELAKGLYNTGRLMKASIFWNPVPHMRNATNFFFTDKGLFGTMRDLPTTVKVLPKAFKAATTQDKLYTQYLRDGVALPGADRGAQMFNQELQRVMSIDAQKSPTEFREIANLFGYGKLEDMVKGIYGASNKVLWSYSDMLSLTRMMELEAKGIPREEAIAQMDKVLPNYRVPSRVGGTGEMARMASKGLQNPGISLFGRYQYNRLKAYANIVKDAVGKEKTIKDRAAALDKMAMLGFLGMVYYPVMDKIYREVLGNQNAEVTRPGLLAPIKSAGDMASGDKTPSQALQSTMSAGLLTTPLELYSGRNLYTGKDILQRDDVSEGNVGHMLYDLGMYGSSKFAPVNDLQRMTSGKMDLPEFLGAQVGVKIPTDEEMQSKAKAKKYSKREQKSADKKRGF